MRDTVTATLSLNVPGGTWYHDASALPTGAGVPAGSASEEVGLYQLQRKTCQACPGNTAASGTAFIHSIPGLL